MREAIDEVRRSKGKINMPARYILSKLRKRCLPSFVRGEARDKVRSRRVCRERKQWKNAHVVRLMSKKTSKMTNGQQTAAAPISGKYYLQDGARVVCGTPHHGMRSND